MAPGPEVLDVRRMVSPQVPLAREIPRAGIVEALKARFDCPVTSVVAGAGCGKTTALAQAVRANLVTPMGIDAWVACEPADEDGRRLAKAIVAALGAEWSDGDEPAAAVVAGIVRLAPVDVCLVLDDLHRLPADSSGERLLAAVLEALPRNGHLLLASRRRSPLALARLRASSQVIDLGPDQLVFSTDELATLASLYRTPPANLADLGGWPALVTLSLSAGAGSPNDYLWEEIVADLSDRHRRTLLAMLTLTDGSFEDAAAVAGHGIRTEDVRHIIDTVPLVTGDPTEQTFNVHDLWIERANDLFPPDDKAETRARALAVMIDRGQILRLGSFALHWGDDKALLSAARALVGTSLIQLPVETATRWLAAAPTHLVDEPELGLLTLAVDVARRPKDPALDAMTDEAIETFADRGDTDGLISASRLALTAALHRRDVARALAVTERLGSISIDGDLPPIGRVLNDYAEAMLAFLTGTIEEAHGALGTIDLHDVPSALSDMVRMTRVNLLMQAGEADEALREALQVRDSSPPVAALIRQVHWYAGNPAAALDQPPELGDLESLDTLSRFIRCSETADLAASLGLRELATAARAELAWSISPVGDATRSGAAAGAVAKTLMLEHDEAGAQAVVDEHLARYSIEDPEGERGLRRRLGTIYILHDELAKRWDSAELTDLHRRTRAIARLAREVRRGRRLPPGSSIDDPELAITCLPLPSTVELAVAAHRDGVPGATGLIDALTRFALGPARSELQRLAAGERPSAAAARTLLTDVPDENRPPLRIGVLGPMSISVGGSALASAELRRSRVRTVLTLLVVRGPMRRDELIELVWPDHDLRRGRQNLRATLSRLRRLLQPDGDGSASPQVLRSEGDVVSLAGPPAVEADLWELRRLVDTAGGRHATSASDGPIELLHQAVALWRGRPVPDLEPVAGLEADIEQIRAEVVEACHRLGELLVTVGHFDEALRCADRTHHDAPYSERAHRLAISALLHLGDRNRLQRRVDFLLDMLDDLGVEPDPSTSMLLARANDITAR